MVRGMARYFACPYLGGDVELTDEREAHIAELHTELLPGRLNAIAETLLEPDSVRRAARSVNTRLFTRWYDDLVGGKFAVVVVISDATPRRNWIITAYVTRRLRGEMEWERS
jgi:hypothetical protein